MPQMAPMKWMILFFFFMMTFLIFNIMNFYFFNFKTQMKNNTEKKLTLHLNWKW